MNTHLSGNTMWTILDCTELYQEDIYSLE